jgi:hypothetical protein
MFGKISVEPKKTKKRHGLAFWVIGVFTFAIESMLGINAAFLVDQSISIVVRNMLDGTGIVYLDAVITLIISLAVGFALIFGGMWTFAGFMDSLGDAKAYKEKYGTRRWPETLVWLLFIAVIALDFTTLCFRASFFAEKGALALFAFFVILIVLPPVLGPLIHVLEHTPRDRRLTKARQHAESLETDDIEHVVETMDPDLRSRWLNDDPTALQEHYERVLERRQEAYDYEQAQVQAREETQKRANQPLQTGNQPFITINNPFSRHPKPLAALPQQANQDGQQNQKRA